jgi:hypothetical protein
MHFQAYLFASLNIALSAVHSLLLQGACMKFRPDSSIHTTIIGPDHRPVPPGACHRASPSSPGHRKWVPHGQSSAHISTPRLTSAVNTRSVPRFCVPQDLREGPRAWSAGHSTERSRALSFGHIVCNPVVSPFPSAHSNPRIAGCLLVVPLRRKF